MKVSKKVIPLILMLAFHMSLLAQSDTQTLQPTFDHEEKKGQWLSEIYSVEFKEQISFVGLSAFETLMNEEGYFKYRTAFKGTWGPWVDFHHTLENSNLDRRIFEAPPITKTFDEIQFSSITDSAFPTIRLFFGYVSSKPYYLQSKANDVDCTCELPLYCDRDCWCPEINCQPLQAPEITQPSHVIVHHSAGFNSSTNFAAVVEYYYDLHVNTNGWDDIGYNWLIDGNGVIYEGRGNMAQGAHFSCMNGNTTGICMIGDFSTQNPTDDAIASLENLIAWEMCDKNLDPSATAYHNNSELNLPVISGHRDGNVSVSPLSCASGTVCPGDVLYEMLPVERLNIADYECLDLTTAMSENFKENQLIIFPNPFEDKLNLSIVDAAQQSAYIRIYEVYGKLVFETEISTMLNAVTLSLDELTKGLYLLELSMDTNREIHRIVKK